jgi:hypothetical protein
MTTPSERTVGLAQGAFNVVGGLWPLVSLPSFEWVYGRKRDVFLQKTVGALLFSIGVFQIVSADSPHDTRSAGRIGIATASTLLAIDLTYIPRGEMRWTYWQDALCEPAWIAAWIGSRPGESNTARTR